MMMMMMMMYVVVVVVVVGGGDDDDDEDDIHRERGPGLRGGWCWRDCKEKTGQLVGHEWGVLGTACEGEKVPIIKSSS